MIAWSTPELTIDSSWLASPVLPNEPDGRSWAAQERRRLWRQVRATGGRVYGPSGAAQRLGLRPTTLYGKMRRQHHQEPFVLGLTFSLPLTVSSGYSQWAHPHPSGGLPWNPAASFTPGSSGPRLPSGWSKCSGRAIFRRAGQANHQRLVPRTDRHDQGSQAAASSRTSSSRPRWRTSTSGSISRRSANSSSSTRSRRTKKLPDNGALNAGFDLTKVEGLPPRRSSASRSSACKKGRSRSSRTATTTCAPASSSCKGKSAGRHYDRVETHKDHYLIKPTIDRHFKPGELSTISDHKDNVHWFKAESDAAFIFNVHVIGYDPRSRRTAAGSISTWRARSRRRAGEGARRCPPPIATRSSAEARNLDVSSARGECPSCRFATTTAWTRKRHPATGCKTRSVSRP